jgi:hypothetical protein
VPGSCDSFDWSDPDSGVHPGDAYVRTGISPTWRDTAPWYLPDQYIDITNLPDGRYLMSERIDAGGRLAERTRENNTTTACVEIAGTTVASQRRC